MGVGMAGMVGAQNGGGSAAYAAVENEAGRRHTVKTSNASNGRRFMAEEYPGSGPA